MIAVAIFFWAVRSGQFQDLDSPAVDILFDDDLDSHSTNTQTKPKEHAANDKTIS
jgi:cbb3-type cytochrome oxidase maturation protein